MLKKVIIFAVLSATLFSSFSFFALAYELDKSKGTVDGYYLFDLKHNLIMAEENTDKLISPSSTAKIMTACIVLESGIDLNTEVTVSDKMITNVSGRNMLLKAGDHLTIEDLLYAMLCGGYNDATHVLALTVSPALYKFAELMNAKANELNMENTRYLNPTGLSSNGMFTTINDIAKLVKYMSENETFVKICSTKQYRLSSKSSCEFKNITNRSALISEYYGLSNFNTGSGDDGDCAVLYYTTDNVSIISIVMNARSNNPENNDNLAEMYSKKLISHATNDYSTQTLKTSKSVITSLPVKYSISSESINVYLKDDLKVFLKNDIGIAESLTYSIYINEGELKAPLNIGDIVGTLSVFDDKGTLITSVPLTVNENIERNTFLYLMDIIRQFVLSKVFLFILILFSLLLIVFYFSRKKKFRKSKKKNKRKRRRSRV